MNPRRCSFPLCFGLALAACLPAVAQQTTISTPFQSMGNSFFENFNVGFGFNIPGTRGAFPLNDNSRGIVGIGPNGQLQPNLQFNFNNPAGNPLGGNGGGGNANFGFGLLGNNGSAFFNLSAGQGNSSYITSTTPSITVMNGATGTFTAATQRPFVIGFQPVVAGIPQDPTYGAFTNATAPSYYSPIRERLDRLQHGDAGQPRTPHVAPAQVAAAVPTPATPDPAAEKLRAARVSSAGAAVQSLSQIERELAAAQATQQQELQTFLDKAAAAESAGRLAVARSYYMQALPLAAGGQKSELQAKILSLKGK